MSQSGGRAVSPGSTRRHFILAGGAAVVLAACSSDNGEESGPNGGEPAETTPVPSPPVTAALTAADFERVATCSLTPEATAGPFPLNEQFDRRDITEGYPGHPLRLGLRVLDADCGPVPAAAVEIWHTDAAGDYSAFVDGGGDKDEGFGTTFLRGTQLTDDAGIVEFATLYPGWYPGRALHVHLRVHVDDARVLTSQIYFPDDRTAEVYATDPYAERGLPDTSNEDDVLAGDPAREGTLLALAAAETTNGPGTLGLVNLGIDLTA